MKPHRVSRSAEAVTSCARDTAVNPATRADLFPPAVTLPKEATAKSDPPLTIEEFLRCYALSRSCYFELKKRGLTPVDFRIGRKALIATASACNGMAYTGGIYACVCAT